MRNAIDPATIVADGHTLILGHGPAYQEWVAEDIAFSKRRAERGVLVVAADYESEGRDVLSNFGRWRNARHDAYDQFADLDISAVETRNQHRYADFAKNLQDHLRHIGARSHPVLLYRPLTALGHFFRQNDPWWQWAPRLLEAGLAKSIVTVGQIEQHKWKADKSLADTVLLTSGGPWKYPDAETLRSGDPYEVTVSRLHPTGSALYAKPRSWPHLTYDFYPDFESATAELTPA